MDAKTREKEQTLLQNFRAGNEDAFDGLVVLYSHKLYQVAYRILCNSEDAEEVVQDAFVRAYRALPSFRGDSSFETWIHHIVSNLARNKYHWNKRRGAGMHISISEPVINDKDHCAEEKEWDLPDDRMQPDRTLEQFELEHDVISIIDALPSKFKNVFLLRQDKHLSYDEIARKTGVPINTVKSRIRRARELIRRQLISEKYDNVKFHK